MRKILKAAVVIILAAGLLLLFPASLGADEEVSFADANLEAAIRQQLGKPEGPILASELAGLTSLYAPNTPIASLSGLEYCVNLEVLVLDSDLEIKDLSPLAGLTRLRQLYLFFNDISDISPLSGLHNLEVLNLEDNFVKDLSPLSGLSDLRLLNLMDNHIEDISPLSGLYNLEWLSLTNNLASDITSLAGLTNLEALFLDGNRISDISPLLANEGISAGDEVRLQLNPLSDESYYEYLPQLEARGVLGLGSIAAPEAAGAAPAAETEAATDMPEIQVGSGPKPAGGSSDGGVASYSLWIGVVAILLVARLFYAGYRRRLESDEEV